VETKRHGEVKQFNSSVILLMEPELRLRGFRTNHKVKSRTWHTEEPEA
jgi:hypothetical protein